MATIEEALAVAVRHHGLGHLDQAEPIYREVLRLDPRHADALHLSGMVAFQRGNGDVAVERLRQAVDERPNVAEFHNNLGIVLADRERLDEATACYRRALELRPDYAEAHCNLGNALKEQERYDLAEDAYRRALEIQPDCAETLNNLAIVLSKQEEKHGQAAEVYRQALEITPDDARLHSNLSVLLADQDELDEAAACCRRAIEIEPDFAEAYFNLGNALSKRFKSNGQDCCDEAMGMYRKAMILKPDYDAAWINLAANLTDHGRLDEATAEYRKIVRARPDQLRWLLHIAALCPAVFSDRREMDKYLERLRESFAWSRSQDLEMDPDDLISTRLGCPYDLQFFDGDLRPIKEAYAKSFERYFAERYHVDKELRPRNKVSRIGIVVTDGHEGTFVRSILAMIEQIDKSEFEFVVICSAKGARVIKNYMSSSATFDLLTIEGRFDEIVETIRAARFDLLYYREVGTDAINYFLPFVRLAPVQCTSFGIQVTTGIRNMDYYISSALVEGEDADAHYSEQLIRSATLLPYRYRAMAPDRPKSREEFGFSSRQHVYACAQHVGKCHVDFDETLAKILRGDPRGVVAITENLFEHAARKLERRFARTIGDVCDRIVFVPRLNGEGYRSLLLASDVLLDAPHFGGVNTTYDGLAMGKPIVTKPTPYHRGRFTAGCYRKMEYSECVVSDDREYVEKALALGTDAAYRDHVVERIGRRTAVLFNDQQTVSEHRRIFRELIERGR